MKKAWAAECFRQPAGPEAEGVRLCLCVCVSLCGEGLPKKGYALSGPQGLELWGLSLPGAPRLPKAVRVLCFCLPFAGQ